MDVKYAAISDTASQAALDNPKQFGQLQKTLENRLFLMVGFSLSIFMAAIVIIIHTNYRNTIIIAYRDTFLGKFSKGDTLF